MLAPADAEGWAGTDEDWGGSSDGVGFSAAPPNVLEMMVHWEKLRQDSSNYGVNFDTGKKD